MHEALYSACAKHENTYWWWVGKNQIILSLVDRYWNTLHPGVRGSACDIGCGTGAVLEALSKTFDVTGVDMSPIAREHCKTRGFIALDGSLPDRLPFRAPSDGSGLFDVIVLSEVIEHVAQDRASIKYVSTLLKPGGIIVSTVPAHKWLWSSHDDFNHHQRRYTRKSFDELFDAIGLERLVLSYYQLLSMPLVVGARVIEKIATRLTGKPPTEPEIRYLPRPMNWALTKAFAVERHWLPHARLPWGTSVISVHRRTVPLVQVRKSGGRTHEHASGNK